MAFSFTWVDLTDDVDYVLASHPNSLAAGIQDLGEYVDTAIGTINAAIAGKAASSHAHGNMSSDGKFGTVAGKIVTTGAGGAAQAQTIAGAGLVALPTAVSSTGSITVTVAENREYSYTAVTSLTMTGAAVNCHGFVTFAGSTPTISVSSFTKSGGDDITTAAASEVWEFSVYAHNSGSYIVWKKW